MNSSKSTIQNGITILRLSGDLRYMGCEYGRILQSKLKSVLDIVTSYYQAQGFSKDVLLAQAELFYLRYLPGYYPFIEGICSGAGLSLDDAKILLAMESYNGLLYGYEVSGCAFLYLPDQQGLIARNYDYPAPFDQCAEYLCLTTISETNKLPVTFLSLPGQIYGATVFNQHLLFAINNGMPSGGYEVNQNHPSLLANLLLLAQNVHTHNAANEALSKLKSDYSLIVNLASVEQVLSYEFASSGMMRYFTPSPDENFCSTNFFQSADWLDHPQPSDDECWLGISRRDNLHTHASHLNRAGINELQKIMDLDLLSGGAVVSNTIYQVIVDLAMQLAYVKITKQNKGWTKLWLA